MVTTYKDWSDKKPYQRANWMRNKIAENEDDVKYSKRLVKYQWIGKNVCVGCYCTVHGVQKSYYYERLREV